MKPTLEIENSYPEEIIVGIDEVGRGCWAGPLVVGAVIVKQPHVIEGINDSKKLSKTKREELSAKILKYYVSSIGEVSVSEINELGLSKAIFLAIARSIESLPVKPTLLLIDGNYNYDFGIKTLNIPKGDSKSISIAASSIIAKVYRDNVMTELSQYFPGYGWETNVGYGTNTHIEALSKLGVSTHHRTSYKPIKALVSADI